MTLQNPLNIYTPVPVCLDEKRKPTPNKIHKHTKPENKPTLDGKVDLDRQSGTTVTKWTEAIALAFIERTKKHSK